MENLKNLTQTPIRSLDAQENGIAIKKFVSLLLVFIVIGALFGFVASTFKGSVSKSEVIKKGEPKKTAGIADKKTFKDKTEGILKEGGVDGEGSFHLDRPGGISQTVYLTSTTIDLSQYVGKKVRVWGATFNAKKAGWLMDVGYVELIN